MSSSDEMQTNEIDEDSCSTSQLFDESLRIASEEAISLSNDYIMYLTNSRDFDRIAAVTSNRMVFLFDLNRSNGFTQLHKSDNSPFKTKDARNKICGIRFANDNPNTIFVAETLGNIDLYDIRTTQTPIKTLHKDATIREPYTCFDVNTNDTILCAGTERIKDDAHVILFDIRKWSTLATFSDCHSQDLTQVKFHSHIPNVLASGSIDGLINVYNVSETNEDDALLYCINTEHSVQTIDWHKKNNSMETIKSSSGNLLTCITDTNDFQLIDVEESEIIFQAERNVIAKQMKRKKIDECYLAKCHSTINGEIFLLGGSHGHDGKCLRSLTIHNKSFKPRNDFAENKQIVRCSIFNPKDNILITAGEGGIVTVWENLPTSKIDNHTLKEKVNTKTSRKSKPY